MRLGIALALAALLIGVMPGGASPAVARAADCTYRLGFRALHDQIPDIVGACVADEVHDALNGDALQQTTNGLLVWRKADNWTAFTDGASTWIAGPLGLRQRANAGRFWWEQNPSGLPLIPPPRAGDRCHTGGLTLALGAGDAGVGHAGVTLTFGNPLDVPCTMRGYVGAQLLDANNDPLPTDVRRGGGYLFKDPGPVEVTVPPGGAAVVRMEWVQVPVGAETDCPTSASLAVTPPDEYDPIIIPAAIMACDHGQLRVTAVQAPG